MVDKVAKIIGSVGWVVNGDDVAMVASALNQNATVLEELINKVENLESELKEMQKAGHWKVVSDGYGDKAYICECSECNDTMWVYKDADRKWNYCPHCGAKMEDRK